MATYHIDYLNGSNVTGNGSAVDPWATITHGITQVTLAAGDLVKVAATGTETDIDTAATFSGDNTIDTSIDLTAQLAVGDLFIYSPGIATAPELDGWMIAEVLSITADTITTTNLNSFNKVFPASTAGLVTITKITNFVDCGSSGNFEDFIAAGATNAVLQDVTFEGGYDATFTAVTGLTNLFRTGLGFNTTVGAVYNSSGTASPVQLSLFKNFRFSKFINVGAQAGSNFTKANVENCHFFTVSILGSGAFNIGSFWGTNKISDVYSINSSINVGAEDATNKVNLHTVCAQRITNIFVNMADLVIVNQNKTSNGFFGVSTSATSYALSVNSSNNFTQGVTQLGKLTYTTSSPSGFNARNILFRILLGTQYNFNITDINIITSPFAPYVFASTNGNAAATARFTLPNGVAVSDLGHLTGGSNQFGTSEGYGAMDYAIVDGFGATWTTNVVAQLPMTTDTVEYITGNSARKVKLGFASTGGSSFGIPLGICKFNNGAQTLQSVTISAKKSSNISSVQLGLGSSQIANLNQQTINTDTFTDYTFTATAVGNTGNPDVEQLLYLNQVALDSTTNPADAFLWIDSVTFNYA